MAAIPENFCCSITQEIMTDPATTAAGNTYERSAITEWLQTHQTGPCPPLHTRALPSVLRPDMVGCTDPLTNRKLQTKRLAPNHVVKGMILEWQERCKQEARQQKREEKQRGPTCEATRGGGGGA